jgi:hypothetical protein
MLEIIGSVATVLLIILIVVSLKKSGKIVFMGRSEKIDFEKDITTIPPIPISAATCSHSWDIVDDKLLEMPHEKKHVLVLQCRTCGMLDKTMAVTSTAPKPLPPPPLPPCNHSWVAVTDNTLDVAHEKKIVVILTCKNCGAIEKTVETTSKAPPPPQVPLPKAECRHKWEVEKRVLLDSAYEQMLESIKVKTSSYSSAKKVDPSKELDLDLNKAPTWMFQKTYVCIRVCTLCGEIDKTIASNFDKEENEEEIS